MSAPPVDSYGFTRDTIQQCRDIPGLRARYFLSCSTYDRYFSFSIIKVIVSNSTAS